MDRGVIEQKIESLRRCVERVRQKCPATADALASDPDAQDILTLNLTRAIQLCVDIGAHLIAGKDVPVPGTMGQTFDVLTDMGILPAERALRMKKAVGFRNIACITMKPLTGRSLTSLPGTTSRISPHSRRQLSPRSKIED